MIVDPIEANGSLQIALYDENGNLKEQIEVPNLVVNAGLAFMAQRLIGVPAVMSHMSIGDTVTAPAAANTILGNELGRVALTSSTNVTVTVANDSSQFVATFPAGTGTGAIVEAGLFNSATANAGTLLCRTVFAVINKGALDSMTITWTVKFS